MQRLLTNGYGGLGGLHFWGGKWKLILILSLLRHTCVSWLREVTTFGSYTFGILHHFKVILLAHLQKVSPLAQSTPTESFTFGMLHLQKLHLQYVSPSESYTFGILHLWMLHLLKSHLWDVSSSESYTFRVFTFRIFRHCNIEPSTASVS